MTTRFLADVNVGRLAKWLRILGYDVLFLPSEDDDSLLRIALREGRVLLTRDTRLLKRKAVAEGLLKVVLVKGDHYLEQLRQVVKELGLEVGENSFSLCLECNSPLVPREKKDVRGLVPPYVYQTQEEFSQCPHCGRIYWEGTHVQNMRTGLGQVKKERV